MFKLKVIKLFLLPLAVCTILYLLFLFYEAFKKPDYYEDKTLWTSAQLRQEVIGGSWRANKIWPEESTSDRILEQLSLTASTKPDEVKSIYLAMDPFGVWPGDSYFKEAECIVDRCTFIKNSFKADAVIFRELVERPRHSVPESQIWILYTLESPLVSGTETFLGSINWTATYRHDSDLVTPYEKWLYYDENVRQNNTNTRNYAEGKSKLVAWFVSNCLTTNSRLEYARELQKYIDVDIYGSCGDLKCPKGRGSCNEMLKKNYKFYLAFENSNCREYITEKFFKNGLQNDVLPIVMGAHPDDYSLVAPDHSYIHVDEFPSARELAAYLHMLDEDDDLYSSYFRWQGTGQFINTKFFCRLCAMLHNPRSNKHYPNLRHWWLGAPDNQVCRKDSWVI